VKLEIIAALVKRFNKTDDKIKALHESVTSQNTKFISFTSAFDKISQRLNVEANKNQQFSQDLGALNRNIKSLSERNKQILLQEAIKPQDGEDGLSAYQIWLEEGNKGTVDDFLESLKGEDGDDGEDGRGIEKIFINPKKHWIAVYTDGTRVDLGKIISETIYQGGGGYSKGQITRIIEAYSQNYRIINDSENLLGTDHFIEMNTPFKTATAPTAVGVKGKEYSIDNSSIGDIYVTTEVSGQTINNEKTQIVPIDSSITIVSNDANWRIK
jgi:hypothetical protein